MGRFFVCLSVCLSARPEAQPARSEAQTVSKPGLRLQAWLAEPQAWLAGPHAWLSVPQDWLDGPERGKDRQTDKRKISPFYRTLAPIGAAALLPPMKTKEVEQGKESADHLMPLGY